MKRQGIKPKFTSEGVSPERSAMSAIGTRRNVHIAGRTVPGIQTSEAETRMVTTTQGKTIPAQFADILTLRETNPVAPDGTPQETTKYLTVTSENLRFSTLRYDSVVGLDFDEDGNMLTLAQLEDRRAADILARQALRAQAQAPTVIALTPVAQPES